MKQKWFKSWFNSPYYHILYSGRDHAEAELFIDNLTSHLQPAKGSRVLDIACGKGRHAIYLHKKGLDVTGIDLSENSIAYAKQFEGPQLHFHVHDMRKLLYINYFDIAVNLFTSFGYFDTEYEHINALKSFRKSLNPGGLFILDFFNTNKVLAEMQPEGEKEAAGIHFKIRKSFEQGRIIKHIAFEADGEVHNFSEKVWSYTLADFERLFAASGLQIMEKFGDYHLQPFNEQQSDRLIMICKKL